MNDIESLRELVTKSERLGVPAEAARTHLEGAQKAIEDGNVDGFERGLTDARASLEESRKSHFLEKYETRVHAVSTMMANAKRLGAELGDATGSLEQAEAALRAGDIAMADILIKQAEVSVGIQIQNFIKNKYPNLALRLPSAGLQAGEWNQYVVEIENRGKLPARNVQIEFSGDLEAKGIAPIAEIGVGEVVPVRVGVKPKGKGAVPVAVGITYKRLFDENRYEDRDGNVLERWTGLLHQLEGVDAMIEKLVLVATEPNADMGALADSPVTLTAMAIDALGANQATEANELMAKAQSTLETDIQLAWQFIEQAKSQADLVKTQLRDRMGDILVAARDTVGEMKGIGADTSQAELLLREAEEA